MKQLTELKDGQSVLLHLKVSEFQNDEDNIILNDYMGNYFHRICKGLNFVGYNYQQAFYDFNEVMSAKKSERIVKPEFEAIIEDYLHQLHTDCIHEKQFLQKIYNLFQSYHPESFTPKIYSYYEVSIDGKNWRKGSFNGYKIIENEDLIYKFIRPIQQSEEELKFLELAEKFKDKYEVNKK